MLYLNLHKSLLHYFTTFKSILLILLMHEWGKIIITIKDYDKSGITASLYE